MQLLTTKKLFKKYTWLSKIGKSDVFFFATYILTQYFLISNFKLSIALAGGMLCIFFYISKSIVRSLFFLMMTHLYLFFPIKEYSVLLIPDKFKTSDFYQNGIERIYGIGTIDIIIFWIILFLIKKVLEKKPQNVFIYLKKNLEFTFAIASWLFLIVIQFINSYYSYFSFYSTLSTLVYLRMLTIMLLTYLILQKKMQQIMSHVISFILLSINSLAIIQFFTSIGFSQTNNLYKLVEESTLFSRPISIFAHPNHFAFINSILLLSYLYLLSIKKLNVIQKATLFFSFSGIILAQSRAIWIAWLLISFLFAWVYRKSLKKFEQEKKILEFIKKNFAIIFVIFAIFSIVVTDRIMRSTNSDTDYGFISIRKTMIQESIEVINPNPFVGVGKDLSLITLYLNNRQGYTTFFPFPPHFQPIQLAIEAGWISVFLFYAPIIILLFSNKKNLKQKDLLKISGFIVILTYFFTQDGIGYETIGLFSGIAFYYANKNY